MSLQNIKVALETRLKAFTASSGPAPGTPIQWENMPYTVTADPYMRVDFLPGDPANPTLGTSFYREVGIMQVTLMYPLAGGSGRVYIRAEALRDWLPRCTTYSYGGTTVMIESTAGIGPGRVSDDRFVLPVRFRYFANINTGDSVMLDESGSSILEG